MWGRPLLSQESFVEKRSYIIHIMNSVYGRTDQYGVRSRWIATSDSVELPIEVYSLAGNGGETGGAEVVHQLQLPLRYQLLRAASKLLGRYESKKKSIWRGFDRALSRAITNQGVAPEAVIAHVWDWTPESLELLRSRYPGILVIRDVVVNRYNEFYSGTPLTEEEKAVDALFSPSTFTTSKLIEWGVPEEKIYEIPFGVDTQTFRPRHDRAEGPVPHDGMPSGPIRFAFSGAVSRRKGADSLLRAWKRLDLKNAELHLYGKVRDVRGELREAQGVIAHGHVPLAQELPKNDVYVFPSTLEGSAKSVYEALACGLPVVTTPDSGSIVRDEVDGLIVPSGDDDALSHAIRRLYEDPGLRQQLGKSARRRAEDHTWEAYGRRVWQAYRQLLEAKAR